jgi:hypothetical protein
MKLTCLSATLEKMYSAVCATRAAVPHPMKKTPRALFISSATCISSLSS